MQTLLAGVKKHQVLAEPFPHLVIEDALPEDLYLQLFSQYPQLKIITKEAELGSNQRFSLSASEVLKTDDRLSTLWRQFVRLHTSEIFYSQVINLFGEHIRSIYPSLERNRGALDQLSTGVRFTDDSLGADVRLDAQVCVNTQVVGAPSAVRRVHVDSPNKLFTGLYYLRHPDDTSEGGDLEFYRFKGRPGRFSIAEIDDRYVEVFKTIKYRRNTLVMFINNVRALHGVTKRAITPFPRYLFNLVGEVQEPLFDLEQYQKNPIRSYLLKSLRGVRSLLKAQS